MGEHRRFRIHSGMGGKVVVSLQCDANKARIFHDPGPVNFTWQQYDDERKLMVREIGAAFSVGIKENSDTTHFRRSFLQDEILSMGPEKVMDWVKELLETFEKEVQDLNSRYRKQERSMD